MYEAVKSQDQKILDELVKDEEFSVLVDYDVKIAMFFKFGKRDKEGTLTSCALKKNGAQCAAQVKLVTPFNRITDSIDCKIILDGDFWPELNESERKAVIHHELTHIEISYNKHGEPNYINENSDKVKLKLINDDLQFWGFASIIEQYGKDSQEIKILQRLVDRFKNYLVL